MKVVFYEDEEDFLKIIEEARSLYLERRDHKERLESIDALVIDNPGQFKSWQSESSNGHISLAVIDLEIDKKDLEGLRAVDALREQALTAEVPIVVFSKVNSPKARRLAYDAGATSYVKKPSTRAKLVRALADIFVYWVGLNERVEQPSTS